MKEGEREEGEGRGLLQLFFKKGKRGGDGFGS